MNLKSNEVHVFPYGSTRYTDPIARILNEQNLSTLVRNLTDYPSYVLNYDSKTSLIDFNIEGYYFRADISNVIQQGSPLYAGIMFNTNSTNGYRYLLGGDLDSTPTEGDGSSINPFMLIGGRYSLNVGEGDTVYVKFNFAELNSSEEGKIVINLVDNIEVKVDEKSHVYETKTDNQLVITGIHSSSCKVAIKSLKGSVSSNIIVFHDNEFSALQFFYELPSDSKVCYLQLLDEQGNVPPMSYLRFNSRSVEGTLSDDDSNQILDIDVIYCGNSTEIIKNPYEN